MIKMIIVMEDLLMALNEKNILSDEELDHVSGGAGENGYVEINGTVIEVLPNSGFTVQLDNVEVITAYMSGVLRMNYVRIFVGDRVTVKRGISDGSSARVTYKFKA